MKFNKPAPTIPQQVAKLQSRGLQINDLVEAERYTGGSDYDASAAASAQRWVSERSPGALAVRASAWDAYKKSKNKEVDNE